MEEYTQKPSFWAILPASVRYDTRLRPNAKLLYAEITALQEASGYCFASNRYLASNFGLKPETITSLLSNLSDAGYITVEIVRDPETQEFLTRKIRTTDRLPDIGSPSPINIGDSPINIEDPPRKISGMNNTSNNNIPPIVPQGGRRKRERQEPKAQPDHKPDRFNGFWTYYPRGENKQGAIRAWDKLKPDDDTIDKMGRALKAQMKSENWQQGIGIPYASTWINGRRWEDELKGPIPAATKTVEEGGLAQW